MIRITKCYQIDNTLVQVLLSFSSVVTHFQFYHFNTDSESNYAVILSLKCFIQARLKCTIKQIICILGHSQLSLF